MAYKKTARQEDPNADTRVKPPALPTAMAPAAPQVSNPMGGAPVQRQWFQPANKPAPWAGHATPPPVKVAVATKPQWTLKDVAANEPAFVSEFKNLLWERFQSSPEKDRGSVFWQGVKQSPEMAAASFVRRALQNMADANNMMNGEKPPALSQAMQTTIANSETRQWLAWVQNKGKMPKIGG